jgi:hypothetical protein
MKELKKNAFRVLVGRMNGRDHSDDRHNLEGESIVSVGDLWLESRDCFRLAQHGDQRTCYSEHDSARTGCVKMGVSVACTERLLAAQEGLYCNAQEGQCHADPNVKI